MQKTNPKTNKSKTTDKPRRASKTNTCTGDTNGSVHADKNVKIENHNQQQTNRYSSRKRKSTSHQAAPNRVRLSKLDGSDSSSESKGDSEVSNGLATSDVSRASRKVSSKRGEEPVDRVTINEDSSSGSSNSDADKIQQLNNNFAQNNISPDISQQGISLRFVIVQIC